MGCLIPGVLSAQIKTITRTDDPVVLECKEFKTLFKSQMESLALMRRQGEEWAPVPFQIDEKKPDGSYAFTMGTEASKDPDPTLDANDELVFMVKDTGDRWGGGRWPDGMEAAVELTVTDPKNGANGWLYLARFSGEAPRSPDDYIRAEIDEANRYRRVVTYEYIMGGPMECVYPDHIAAKELPNGRPGVDILDRLKMRGDIVLPMGITIPFAMDEITKSDDRGYIDGPVRVLHLSEGYMELTRYIKIRGEGYSLISYYVNHMIWPMTMDIPAISLVSIENFRGFMDFNENVFGSHPFSAANPYNKDVVFDGKMSEAEKRLDTQTEIDWTAGFGPQGSLVNRLYFVPRHAAIQKPYFMDDPALEDSPEEFPGVHGAGYRLEMPEDPVGSSTFYQYYYFMSDLKPEEVSRILDILDHPLEVKVRSIESVK
jgi:hypothetical protein